MFFFCSFIYSRIFSFPSMCLYRSPCILPINSLCCFRAVVVFVDGVATAVVVVDNVMQLNQETHNTKEERKKSDSETDSGQYLNLAVIQVFCNRYIQSEMISARESNCDWISSYDESVERIIMCHIFRVLKIEMFQWKSRDRK